MYCTVGKVEMHLWRKKKHEHKNKTAVEKWEQACLFSLIAIKKRREGNHLPWREHSDAILDHQHGHRIASAERESLFKPFLPFLYCPKVWYLIRWDGARVNLRHDNTQLLQLQLLMSTAIQDHYNIKNTVSTTTAIHYGQTMLQNYTLVGFTWLEA